VRENRKKYREKFATIVPMLEPVMHVRHPDAGFYLWAGVPPGPDQGVARGDDVAFARELFAATHVTVLPGRYLAREARGVNPGHGYVRMALVPEIGDCVEAARRIVEFCG
jgi:N-succinyldiaminopimelate aminotransferase